MNIQYNTISNWVNLAKGEHICQFCGRSYPWKAALERHILKQHEVRTMQNQGEGDRNAHKGREMSDQNLLVGLQDGEGDGMKSREGIPVTHYDEQLKEEVVAFAKATSQKEARDRLSGNFLESSDISAMLGVE